MMNFVIGFFVGAPFWLAMAYVWGALSWLR